MRNGMLWWHLLLPLFLVMPFTISLSCFGLLFLFWSVALIFPVSAFLFHLAVAEPPAVDDLTLNRLLYGAARLLFFLPVLLFQHWARLEYRAALLMSFVAYLSNELRRCHPFIYKCQLPAVVQVELAGASLGASKPVWGLLKKKVSCRL